MKPSILEKLQQLSDRLEEVTHLLGQPEATSDMDNYRKLTREHDELTPVVEVFQNYQLAQSDLADAEEMLSDPEMKDFAAEEIEAAKAKIDELDTELQKLLLPKDADDDKNIFIEVRAGTGGDEAALFAGDLLRMYSRYAERNRWQVEIVSANESELGGYKEVIARIVGLGAYSRLKFESGGHRVQRVPATESQVALRQLIVLEHFDHGRQFSVFARELAVVVHVGRGFGLSEEVGYFFQTVG